MYFKIILSIILSSIFLNANEIENKNKKVIIEKPSIVNKKTEKELKNERIKQQVLELKLKLKEKKERMNKKRIEKNKIISERIKKEKLEERKKRIKKLKEMLKSKKKTANQIKIQKLKAKLKKLKEAKLKAKNNINKEYNEQLKENLLKIKNQIKELENNFIIKGNVGYFKININKDMFFQLMKQIFTKDELVKIKYDKNEYILEFYDDNILVGGYVKQYKILLRENNLFNFIKIIKKDIILDGNKEDRGYIKEVYQYYNDKDDIKYIITYIIRELNEMYKKGIK